VLIRIDLREVYVHILLPKIYVLKKSFAALLHLNKPTFKSLPKLVVGSPAYIARVPNVMFNELFNLMFPSWL